MILTFLISSISALWLASSVTRRRIWVTVASIGIALVPGFLYLMLFRISLTAPRVVALGADAFLVVILIASRKIIRRR
jgi:hypothetical protein